MAAVAFLPESEFSVKSRMAVNIAAIFNGFIDPKQHRIPDRKMGANIKYLISLANDVVFQWSKLKLGLRGLSRPGCYGNISAVSDDANKKVTKFGRYCSI